MDVGARRFNTGYKTRQQEKMTQVYIVARE